jgi:hypothetical protein
MSTRGARFPETVGLVSRDIGTGLLRFVERLTVLLEPRLGRSRQHGAVTVDSDAGAEDSRGPHPPAPATDEPWGNPLDARPYW